MNKKSTLFSIICLSFILSVSAVFYGNAAAADVAAYYRFESVTAVCADASGFYAADESGLHILDTDGQAVRTIEELANASGLAVATEAKYALKDGKVYSYFIGGTTTHSVILDEASFRVEYITSSGDALYCAANGEIRKYDKNGNRDESFDGTAAGNLTGLTAVDGQIYYSVKSGAYSDFYVLGNPVPVYDKIKSDGAVFAARGNIYTVSRNGRVMRLDDAGANAVTDENKFVVAANAFGDGICYATDIGELYVSDYDGNERLIAASESTAEGFYARPAYTAARMGRLYVCDYLNDRVAVTDTDGEILYIALPRPTAVCVSNSGTVVVAHSGGKISIYDSDLTSAVTQYTLPAAAKGLYIDNGDGLYALADGALYKLTDGSRTLQAEGLTAACTSSGGDRIYTAKGTAVYDTDGNKLFDAGYEIMSMRCDAADCFYIAYNRDGKGIIARRATDGTITEIADDYGSEGLSLSISRTTAGGAGYGDLIVADKQFSRVTFVKPEVSGIIMASSSPALTPYDEENVLRTALRACSLYASLDENEVALRLTAGAKLIVAKYNIPEDANLSYVLYDDMLTDRLISGFVFKSNLSEPLESVAPPATTGVVYTANANLYLLPSLKAEKAKENLPQNSIITLLPFADYKSGDIGWYRARTEDGTHGYIPAGSVSVRNFIPDSVRPQYNAEIKSYRDSIGAKVYTEENGVYTEIENSFLPVGTRIEVVGVFDTSEKYTHIKYFDDRLGTCDCYVETVYVDYNNISVVQIIAIVLAVITFILLVILLIRLYMKKRKL